MKKPRILLIAESANPEWASGPLVGWSLSQAISELTQTHMVTHIRNRNAILRAGLIEGKNFTSIDSEKVSKFIYKFGLFIRRGSDKGFTTSTALSALSYYYFEHLVWKVFGDRIINGGFDIVHRLTPISPTIPSLIAKKCKMANVPFIVGPINGGLPWPRGFNYVRYKEREWFSHLRFAHKLLPGYRSTRRNAAAILIGSKVVWNQMPSKYYNKCIYIPENGINSNHFTLKRTRQASRPIRAVFVGRLVPCKGIDMLIKAIAPLAKRGDIVLDIFGDGPQMAELRSLVKNEQVQEQVNLNGWVEHAQLQKRLVDADIFTFLNIHEFGGAVVLEAMALGVVPIVVNYGGPAELATHKTGFLVNMGSREYIIRQLRELLTELVLNPKKIDQKSDLSIHRIREYFTWQTKAKQILEIYKWVLGERENKPDFGMPFPDLE